MKSKLLFLATTLLFASCWENKANKEQQTEEKGDSLVQTEKLTTSIRKSWMEYPTTP